MNKRALLTGGIIIAAILMIIVLFASTSNRAISLEEQVMSAESDIQVQEKRRTDLIYNLADCVKDYDRHEAETLLNIAEARNEGESTNVENVATQIAAVAEAYPELKSSENYRELMNELAITENKIAESRNSYNNQIRAYNKYTRKFPNKQILGILGYQIIDYEYLEYNAQDKEPVTDLFGD